MNKHCGEYIEFLLFGSLHKAWKPWEYLSLQAGEMCGDAQAAALPTELECRPLHRATSCSALLPLAQPAQHLAAHHSCSAQTLGCAHTQLTLCSATSEMLAKHLHCITDMLRGLSVVCLVHTDFLTHIDFLDFQGKSIRTNLICFFPLTTKGAKSFYKIFLSLLPSMFYDCNNCKT